MKINTLKLSLLVLVMLSLNGFAQSDANWKNVDKTKLSRLTNLTERTFPLSSSYYSLNLESFRSILFSAPEVFTKESNTIVSVPNTSGKMEKFKIWEDSNFTPELQAQYPSIRAYSGSGIDDPTATLKISIAPTGIQTMILRADKQSEFMEPLTNDGLYYALYNSGHRSKGELPLNCTTKADRNLDKELINAADKSTLSNTQSLKTFRLALSCTAEYTAYYGGTVTGALAGMNATMTRVNGIYQKDIAVKLILITNNTSIIYTNAATDPYDNADPGAGSQFSEATWNLQLQNTLTSVIGNANYDIGHLFGRTGGGGNAGCIGCVCVNPTAGTPAGKGSGFTSPANGIPQGDTFDIDYVAHEMGHQLGANHTYSFEWEGDTSTAVSVQVEPGSGSTIMGYAGISGGYDVQPNSDDYFTYRSILQIQTNLATKTCAATAVLGNTPPVVLAGADYTIPKGTPFMLTGSATDAEGGALTYTWEQNNPIVSAAYEDTNSIAYPSKAAGPTFRSVAPSASPVRYFPALSKVLSNTLTSTYESVSNVGRALNFTLTARDNAVGGGQTNTDTAIITVSSAVGPFNVTSQSISDISYTQGSTQNVTWAVNNTTALPGSANVNILLSIDGGLTYPIVLASATPNDGSQAITIPNVAAPYCRIMVKPTDNVYFDVNTTSFAIGYVVTTTCTTYTNNTVTAIPDGGTNYSVSAISVPSTAIISNVNININITHPATGQLYLIAQSPSGTQVNLFGDACGQDANLNVTFSDSGSDLVCGSPTAGTYKAYDALSAFTGESAAGNWLLGFIDPFAQSSGTLNSWSVEVCSLTAVLSTTDFELSNITLYPNPSTSVVTISLPQSMELPQSFTIYNSLGQTIQDTKVNSVSNLTVNTSGLSEGIYFIKVNKDNESKTLRFIKN